MDRKNSSYPPIDKERLTIGERNVPYAPYKVSYVFQGKSVVRYGDTIGGAIERLRDKIWKMSHTNRDVKGNARP